MKKLLSLSLLLLAATLPSANVQAQPVTVLYPNGGESLPRNGQMNIWWSNAVPLETVVYLERYDDNGSIAASTVVTSSYGARDGVDYVFFDASTYTPGRYKARVIGTAVGIPAPRYTDESDGFFFITGDATMSIEPADYSDWLPSNTKKFRITWDGFAIGDPYSVILLAQDQNLGEGYGFTIATGRVSSVVGSLEFKAPFPDSSMSLYPPVPSVPVDGKFIAMFMHGPSYLRVQSYPINIILKEVHLHIFEMKDYTAEAGSITSPLAIVVDATYSPNDITSLTIPILMDSDVEGMTFVGGLTEVHGKKIESVSKIDVIRYVSSDKYAQATFTTHGFVVPKGTVRYLSLTGLSPNKSGLIHFSMDRSDPTFAARGKHHDDLSVAVGWNSGPTLTITNGPTHPRH